MKTSQEITNYENIIDSRDVIARIEWLEGCAKDSETPLDDDETDELAALRALADEASGYAPDWQYGQFLIRDRYFQEYAMQLADDIGAIDANASWPSNCIDWEQAARELRVGYTAVDFGGVTYWVR